MSRIPYPVITRRSRVAFDEATKLGTALASVDAAALGGVLASDVLNRSQHTGPRYADWQFPNAGSGFVLRGRDNGGLYRMYPLDDESDALKSAVEILTAAASGDVVFPTSSAGPVLVGRYKGGLYRWLVRDEDPTAPMLGIEKLPSQASVLASDYQFGHNGFSWLNRGRLTGKWIRWYINDADGGDWLNDYPAVEYAFE